MGDVDRTMSAQWRTETDAAAVADAACRLIGMAASAAIAERGRFRLALAGGSTPLETYRRLAASDQQWKKWTLYYGDERCHPTDHPERNSVMVAATGLAALAGKHYPIPAELGGKAAAAKYRERVAAAVPFDMVVLGMGQDGHTASLFPGHKWPDKPVFAIDDAPKPPPERVTLGPGALRNCRAMLVLITGDDKADAVRRWRDGEPLPIARVADLDQAQVLVDRSCFYHAITSADPAGA
jgi:6-phosphogluconolactonase